MHKYFRILKNVPFNFQKQKLEFASLILSFHIFISHDRCFLPSRIWLHRHKPKIDNSCERCYTRCPKKNTAVACCHSRATAVFLLGHSVSSSTHSAIGQINLMEIVNNTSHGGKLFCLHKLKIELRQKDPKFLI